ncbi:MAG: radical SAM protein [Betaproteobacteria bacterium]|nr:radical SAM protein [Betaproteobacteria bacterium]
MSLDQLTSTDHNRDFVGLRYVYPVVSRRAGGVSIGINLNVNNACNWRCVYCNVPNLTRGSPPAIELDVLEQELRAFLRDVQHGDFMQRHVREQDRQLKDIAFSGNGEPTSAKEFPQVISLVEKVLADVGLLGCIKVRLITNGSLVDRPAVLEAVSHLSRLNGEVWFKVDAGSQAGFSRINDVILNPQSHLQRLRSCAAVCPTFIQTCMFALDGMPPCEKDILAYLDFVSEVKDVIAGVHLYGLARWSMQPEAGRLSRLSAEWLEALAGRVRQLGVQVFVSP